MFTKEERLFIWKEAYREIEELRTGEYICVALKHAVFKFFVTPKNSGTFYGMPLYELVRTYFPELEKKKSMAKHRKRHYKRIRIIFLLIYFIHQIKFWVLACRFVRIDMPISVS